MLALVLEEGPSEHTLSIFTVVSRLLKHYARLQRTQGNQKKVGLVQLSSLIIRICMFLLFIRAGFLGNVHTSTPTGTVSEVSLTEPLTC